MEKQKELEKAIKELFVLFKINLERETEVDWNTAEVLENKLIRVTVNESTFLVEFEPTKTMITYYTSLEKREYKQVDVEYEDGKWKLLGYSDWKTHSDFDESDIRRVIKDYLFYARANM